MTRVFKFAAVGSFSTLILWWLATSLTASPPGSIPDLDWPDRVSGLTTKFVIQICTILLMSVPFVIAGWLIIRRIGNDRTEKSREIE